MIVVNLKVIEKFIKKHPQAKKPLNAWVAIVKKSTWTNFADIRSFSRSVDSIGDKRFCFNIKGNHIRLIAEVSIVNGIVQIDKVLTHDEYTKQLKMRKL